ncbi:MAG: ECF transporter S component [Lachnospiraceae bacterium]|nr:ECF transporter S component [Lachnospiraceae bacterium]
MVSQKIGACGSETKSREYRIRMLCGTSMLSAVAFLLMFMEFPLPMFIPPFIKMDFSDLPALIASFAYGPISGVLVCLIKNLLHLFMTQSGGVGELANFILGGVFALVAGIVYRCIHSKKGALIASLSGTLVMAVVSIPTNYYIVYPFYTSFMPLDAIIQAYQAIIPSVSSLMECLLIFNFPFTLFKGIFATVITFLIYKPLSPILKGR